MSFEPSNFMQFWKAVNSELTAKGEPELMFGDARDRWTVALDPTKSVTELQAAKYRRAEKYAHETETMIEYHR